MTQCLHAMKSNCFNWNCFYCTHIVKLLFKATTLYLSNYKLKLKLNMFLNHNNIYINESSYILYILLVEASKIIRNIVFPSRLLWYLLLITTLTSSICTTSLLVFNQLSMGWLIFEEEWIVKGSWHVLVCYLASRLLDYKKDEECPYGNCSNHQHQWQSNVAMGWSLRLRIYCRCSTHSLWARRTQLILWQMKRIKRVCLPVVGTSLGNTVEETNEMEILFIYFTKSMISYYCYSKY